MEHVNDWIRDAIADAAASQGMTAYAISKSLEWRPTEESVNRYLAKRCHLGTQHVSRICEALGIERFASAKKRRKK
jgi:hypothetical protein